MVFDIYENFRTVQVIYFDAEDAEMDGLGWNIVDGGSIASRYGSLLDALKAVALMNLPYVVLGEGVTRGEACLNLREVFPEKGMPVNPVGRKVTIRK